MRNLIILILFLLTACGGDKEGDTTNITCITEVTFDDYREGNFSNDDNCVINIVGDTHTDTENPDNSTNRST